MACVAGIDLGQRKVLKAFHDQLADITIATLASVNSTANDMIETALSAACRALKQVQVQHILEDIKTILESALEQTVPPLPQAKQSEEHIQYYESLVELTYMSVVRCLTASTQC